MFKVVQGIPALLESVAVGWSAHQGDVPVLVLVHGDAHHSLELGRERVQDVGQRSIEVMLSIIQRLAAETTWVA